MSIVKMDFEQEKVCRLCLEVVVDDFEEIDETMRQMFDILLLKLDLNITRDPIICWNCVEIVKKYFKFKSTYFSTERIMLSFSTDRENTKYDIKVIYKDRKDVEMATDEDLNICRICMARFKFQPNTLNYSFEDFNTIENPMTCTDCRENLKGYFKFIVNCLVMEGKIKSYCKKEKIDSMDKVNLGNARHLFLKHILEPAENCPQISEIKEESNACEDTKCAYPDSHNGFIKLEKLDIKEEDIDLEENSYKNIPMGLGIYTLSPKEFEKESKFDTISLKISEGNIDKVSSNHENALKVNKNQSSDMRINEGRNSFKCSLCAYEAKLERNLKSHMLVHKDVSEIKMHKCPLCAYETKRKQTLKKHMFVHKDVSEIEMHKCSLCAYESKQKRDLRRHLLVHKDVSEITMQKCSLCAYETKRKETLKKHMLVHKVVPEIKMHKCSLCDYKSKKQSDVKRHFLTHRNFSKIAIHKCPSCAYVAEQKNDLKIHMLGHKGVSEIKMHKCSLCAEEPKQKSPLKNDPLIQQIFSEINRKV